MQINLVHPRGIYRGPQPQSFDDWSQLEKLGIKYALDLETGSQFLGDGSPLDEMLTSESYGIKTYCHPLGRILPPTEIELSLAMEFIESHYPCYVHCQQGVDRTGMVCARYDMAYGGSSRSRAIERMKQCGMHRWYYWWSWFL